MPAQKKRFLLSLGAATAVIPTAILVLCVNLLLFVPLIIGVVVFCLGLRKSNTTAIELAVFTLVAFAWIGPFLITGYLSRPGQPVLFIVPPRFRGTIEVIKDRKRGQDLSFDHGTYTIVMPASGFVRLRDTSPFHRWHEELCRDIDGKPKHLEGKGTTTGIRRISPNRSEASGDSEETIYRWEVR
jgi:hypothetical protein